MQFAMRLGDKSDKRPLQLVKGTTPISSMSAMELVTRLENSAAAPETKAHMIQLYFNTLMNDELELLAEHALQMQVEMDEPAVFGAVSRGDAREGVRAALSIMRRRMSKLLRDHQRFVDEE